MPIVLTRFSVVYFLYESDVASGNTNEFCRIAIDPTRWDYERKISRKWNFFNFPAQQVIDERKQKLTKYSSMGFSRALLYDFCISVCLSACAMCKALASNLPVILNRLSGVNRHEKFVKINKRKSKMIKNYKQSIKNVPHRICSPKNHCAPARSDHAWSSRFRCGYHLEWFDVESLQLKIDGSAICLVTCVHR